MNKRYIFIKYYINSLKQWSYPQVYDTMNNRIWVKDENGKDCWAYVNKNLLEEITPEEMIEINKNTPQILELN